MVTLDLSFFRNPDCIKRPRVLIYGHPSQLVVAASNGACPRLGRLDVGWITSKSFSIPHLLHQSNFTVSQRFKDVKYDALVSGKVIF